MPKEIKDMSLAELRAERRRQKDIIRRRAARVAELNMERNNASWKLRVVEARIEELKANG
jgi:hypothetical protein